MIKSIANANPITIRVIDAKISFNSIFLTSVKIKHTTPNTAEAKANIMDTIVKS